MEKEKFTAYDLEKEEPRSSSEIPQKKLTSDLSDGSDGSDESDQSDGSDRSDRSDESDFASKEIARMVGEMGAEKVLEIIRGNRNAAIDQIVRELEAESDYSMQSGTSIASHYSSIFDLAAMA